MFSEAGELAQVANGEAFHFLAYVEFQENASALRGNHYHARKTETLYIIRGKLLAKYKDIETGEEFETTLETGDLVTISPGCAHGYLPLEYTQALELSPAVYDINDTIRHELHLSSQPTGPVD